MLGRRQRGGSYILLDGKMKTRLLRSDLVRSIVVGIGVLVTMILFNMQLLFCQVVYYVDSSGSDLNDGRSPSKAWRSLLKVSSSAFQPGDQILLKRGQEWRADLTVPSSGAVGRPILFSSYGDGPNPLISGADLIQSWDTLLGYINIWVAPVQMPRDTTTMVHFDNVRGMRANSLGALRSTYQWFWAEGLLYVYSPTNPSKLFRNPGVEASVRNYPIRLNGISYVNLSGINVTKSNSIGIMIYDSNLKGASHVLVQDLETFKNSTSGIMLSISNVTLRRVHSHHNGLDPVHDHGIYIGSSGPNHLSKADDFLVEYCATDGNAGGGIHEFLGAGGIIRYNRVFGNGSDKTATGGWGIVISQPAPGKTVSIYYNVVYGNSLHGIHLERLNSRDTVNVYNNTITNNGAASWGEGCFFDNAESTAVVRFANNLCYANKYFDLRQEGSARPYNLDYNLYGHSGGPTIAWGHSIYYSSQFQSYQNSSSQDRHSLFLDSLVNKLTNENLQPESYSPCIDAGANVGIVADIEGVRVPQGSKPDIGAFERPLLATPTILSPSMSDKINRPYALMTWIPSPRAQAYNVQLSHDTCFVDIVHDISISGTSLSLGPLEKDQHYAIRVKAESPDGSSYFSPIVSFTTTDIGNGVDPNHNLPREYRLNQNYPNPFNPKTTIGFVLPIAGLTRIKILDCRGAEITTLISDYLEPGVYAVDWSADNCASGTYFVQLKSRGFAGVRKALLLR
jgi:hypothetical protein